MAKLNMKEVITCLKELLKKQGITYGDLAKKMDMSESGIQKIFSGDDISLTKLSKICEVLNVQVGSIIDRAEDIDSTDISFNSSQEKFLMNNPNYFDFFWALKGTGFDAKKVQERFNLDGLSTQKYLLELDKLGLIELHENNRIKASKASVTYWKETTELSRKMLGRYQRSFLKNAQEKYDNVHIAAWEIAMSEELQKEMFEALTKLYQEYFQKAVKERPFTEVKDGERTGTMIISSPVRDVDFLNIPRII